MASDDEQADAVRQLATQRRTNDFSLVLLKTIESIKSDPAQFRNLIYEMARVHLQKEAWHQNPPMNILEMRRMMLALETAIERVETVSAERDGIPTLAPAASVQISDASSNRALAAHDAIVLIDHAPVEGTLAAPAARVFSESMRPARLTAPLKAILRLGVIALLAAAAVIVLDRKFHLLSPAPLAPVENAIMPAPPAAPAETATAAPVRQPPGPPPSPSGPLPSVYGIYAVSDGQLYELEPLVGRVPDQKVFMSAITKSPSRTVLPDGQVSFIVYRRDVTSSAPDRVTVRVIAKIMRALTFNKAGQPSIVNVDDAWAIRNVSFDYRVAPSSDSAEMIVIKPESDTFVLPPGRYGLVIKGLAYDFTVGGAIREPAQCLERTEAANGTFYSECRKS
jgi:hypothetical protein